MSNEERLENLRRLLECAKDDLETVQARIDGLEDEIAPLERQLRPWPWPTTDLMILRELLRAFSTNAALQFARRRASDAVMKDYPR